MDLIRWSMNRPVTIAVGVILTVFFGLAGLSAIPIQLTPTVDEPVVTVVTNWPGRSPQEIVDEITKEQEERLKNVENLKNMYSQSVEGSSTVTLEFYIGTPIERALQEVSDALRQVPEYPEDVDEPAIQSAEGGPEKAIAWIIIDLSDEGLAAYPDYDISTLYDAMDREVKPFIERIGGVAQVNVYGGREKQVQVQLDPTALAQRGLSHADVVLALRRENRNISGGTIEEGKRDFRIRVVGQFETAEDVLSTIVAYRDGRPVYVRDLGTAEIGFEKLRGFVRSFGKPCLAMNIIRQSGSNVMTIMADVREKLVEVQEEILPRLAPGVGKYLRLRQVYDETNYINAAISLVVDNLWACAALAVASLLLMLRSLRFTIIITLAIPICIIGTFLVMLATGRTLNVVSLAGLAFSTGVVVDAANVVIENIDRRRRLGDAPLQAVYRGTTEVWTAVLAGGLTSIAVFIPVLTIQEEAGQLFFDISLAMAVSTALSLVVAITVVPSATALIYRIEAARAKNGERRESVWHSLFGLAPMIERGNARFAGWLRWLITGWRAWSLSPAVILFMIAASVLGSSWLMPPLDYLPAGNRNLVFGGLLIPPGFNPTKMQEHSETIETAVKPYFGVETGPDSRKGSDLPPIFRFEDPQNPFRPVGIANFFIGGFNGGMFVGGTSMEEQVVIPVGSLISGAMNSLPDAYGGARQASIFGRAFGGGNNIEVEISGPSYERVVAAAGAVFGVAGPKYGFMNVRPNPSNFSLGQPEWRIRLTPLGRELGLRTEDLGIAVRGLFDGAFAGDFRLDGRNVDMVVMPTGGRLDYKERLAQVPVKTPQGATVPLDSVVELVSVNAPQEIRRVEELPSVTVAVTPTTGRALGEMMEEISREVIEPLRAQGVIEPTMRVRLEGTAAKLATVRTQLLGARPEEGTPRAGWQRFSAYAGYGVGVLGLIGGMGVLVRHAKRRAGLAGWAASGVVLLAILIGGSFVLLADDPQLTMARMVWALLVVYLLMCALFEDFLYPLVIMLTVPLATLGGFGALSIVHHWTLANPTQPAQQLDVLTMLGFVVLIGTVVNNAILLVEQALNFMNPAKVGEEFAGEKALDPIDAVCESVRTRIRPIFMTTLTTLGGGLPLVISPGAGSEMYRGFGAVVLGGLTVSTVFTLVLVPLVFALVLRMRSAVRQLWTRTQTHAPG